MLTDVTSEEVRLFERFIKESVGIELGKNKRTMLINRLASRILQLGICDYSTYFYYLTSQSGRQSGEHLICIDLLTTNETYFFRELKQLNQFKEIVIKEDRSDTKIWSSACSSGEECYSLAMVLGDIFGRSSRWQVLGTDISSRMLAKARQGIYQNSRLHLVPEEVKNKYLMRGFGAQEDRIAVVPELKSNVHFHRHNLLDKLDVKNESFDFIFCRNVMIYFDLVARKTVMSNQLLKLKEKGYLFIGLSESLRDLNFPELVQIGPSLFQKNSSQGLNQ